MPRRLRSNRGLSAQQAHQALSVLLHDGKVRASDVWDALKRRERLVRELRERLVAFERGVLGGGGRKAQTAYARRRRKTISAARRAAMRSHGRYLAAVRPLSRAARAKVKTIREKSGVTAAIAAAKRMVRG
jgi:hypothetical protein